MAKTVFHISENNAFSCLKAESLSHLFLSGFHFLSWKHYCLLWKTQTFPTNFTGKVKFSSFTRLKKQFLENHSLVAYYLKRKPFYILQLSFSDLTKLKLYSHKVSTFIFTFFAATNLTQFPLKGNIYSGKKNPYSRFCLWVIIKIN